MAYLSYDVLTKGSIPFKAIGFAGPPKAHIIGSCQSPCDRGCCRREQPAIRLEDRGQQKAWRSQPLPPLASILSATEQARQRPLQQGIGAGFRYRGRPARLLLQHRFLW